MWNKFFFRVLMAVLVVAALLWMVRHDPAAPFPSVETEPQSEHAENSTVPFTLATTTESGSGAIRIDIEHSDPTRTLPWLMSRGGRVVLVRGKSIVAEMDADFQLRPAEPVPENANYRDVTREILRATGKPLPNNAEDARLLWPSDLWDQLTRALEDSADLRHDLVSELKEGVMEIRDRPPPQRIIIRFD